MSSNVAAVSLAITVSVGRVLWQSLVFMRSFNCGMFIGKWVFWVVILQVVVILGGDIAIICGNFGW